MAFIKESGKLAAKGEMKTGKTDKGEWKRIEFRIEVPTSEGHYKSVVIQAKGDKAESVNRTGLGTILEVEYYVTAREWNGKYYNDVMAWSISGAAEADTPKLPERTTTTTVTPDGDLPF